MIGDRALAVAVLEERGADVEERIKTPQAEIEQAWCSGQLLAGSTVQTSSFSWQSSTQTPMLVRGLTS